MKQLTVFYDSGCGLCTRARNWLREQPTWVDLNLVPVGWELAHRRYPDLNPEEMLNELTVVDDLGGVYRGADAWLMCLWATRRYRSWALRLARPGWKHLARRAFDVLSANRHSLSRWLGFYGPDDLPAYSTESGEGCEVGGIPRAIIMEDGLGRDPSVTTGALASAMQEVRQRTADEWRYRRGRKVTR